MLLKVAVQRYDGAKNNKKKSKIEKIIFECTELLVSSAFVFYVAFMSSVLRPLVLYMLEVSLHASHVQVPYVPSYPPCLMCPTCLRALRVLVPYVPSRLTCLAPYMPYMYGFTYSFYFF